MWRAAGCTAICHKHRVQGRLAPGEKFWSILQISAYGASDRAAFAAVFKLTHYPIFPEISPSLNGGYGWLEVECNRCKTRASLPLYAIRRPRDTPIWKLEAALKCRSCKKDRYAPPVHMIKLTETREITPYVWVYPDDDR
jgi:hypothetical protein